MKKTILTCALLVFIFSLQPAYAEITLNGSSATYKQIVSIAKGEKVAIEANALKRVKTSHDVLISAAETGHKIYGLTVGVGLNKDRKMIDAKGKLSKEVIEASKKFNKGLIYAHCGGTGAMLAEKHARTIMTIRLNNMLFGGTGVQEEIVVMLKDMLNSGITPLIPEGGSVGMGDITVLGHLGLAMIGEGQVYYQGKITGAKEALTAAKLKPVELFAKDALSIVSTNALSASTAVLMMSEAEQLIKMSKIIYALNLEAFNGNIAPFSREAAELRPYPYFVSVSKELREILAGSYLWRENDERALQDPLSYRDAAHHIGAFEQAFHELNAMLTIQLNSSDDNPGVLTDNSMNKAETPAEKVFQVKNGGAVVPTSNFEPIEWVLAMEKFSVMLGSMSNLSTQRILRLDDDSFTKLSRFLGTDDTVHAFGAMQKPFAALNAENLFLANPIMLNNTALAGNIEDVSTNAPAVANKTRRQVENLFKIYGIELLHTAQAIDLRKSKADFNMAPSTEKLYNAFRKKVSFLQTDRPLTNDFAISAEFVKTY